MDQIVPIIHKVVYFLEGKKAIIVAIIGAVLSFLVARGAMAADLGALLQTIIAILTGGALGVGSSQAYKDNKQGGKL